MASGNTYFETLLISEDMLKIYSPLSNNVGIDRIIPFIFLAQNFYIEPLLGTALLEELQEQIDNDELTDENKALLTHIGPSLANWSTYLAARSLAYTFTEKGLTKEHSENSESLDYKELGSYILNLKDIAEQCDKALVKFLCRCQELYPLWTPPSDCTCSEYLDEDSKKQKKKFSVYFPKQVNDCGNCGCDTENFIN